MDTPATTVPTLYKWPKRVGPERLLFIYILGFRWSGKKALDRHSSPTIRHRSD